MPIVAACRRRRRCRLAPPLPALAFAVLALAAGCVPSRPQLALNDGRQHFTQDRATAAVVCDGRPFVVDANRVTLTITGRCSHIVVAGNHNDIETDVVAGGTVEITGAHNDVTWRQLGPGARPVLVDRGQSNTFRRGMRETDEPS